MYGLSIWPSDYEQGVRDGMASAADVCDERARETLDERTSDAAARCAADIRRKLAERTKPDVG